MATEDQGSPSADRQPPKGGEPASRPRRKVGLVLSSGSSRGWAHIGAIECLEEAGIPIDLVAGCSVGAFVGAVWASGHLPSLKDFVLQMDGRRVFSYLDVIFPRSGLIDSKKVNELFSMHSDAATFADLRVPLQVVTTDLRSGERLVINSGSLIEALRATMSVPGIFPPLEQKGRWLVDGGLVDPVPVGLARSMGADVVIAVDLTVRTHRLRQRSATLESDDDRRHGDEVMARIASNWEGIESKVRSWFRDRSTAPRILEVLESSVQIMQERIKRVNFAVEPPDVLIQPILGDLKMFDYDQVERSISEGAERTREKLQEIRELVEG